MKKEELIARLSAPVNFQMVVNLTTIIEDSDLAFEDLFEVSFHPKKEVAFRASWMLEYLVTQRPSQFCPYIETFLSLLPEQKNLSAMRHYAKIVALLTEKKSSSFYEEALKFLNFEPVIETLFIWLVEPDTPVAVKVNCMQALANLARKHGWIKEDLLDTIDHLADLESYAFFARAKMVRKQLKRV